jgi:preprotein translocase subunit SecA
MIEKGVSKRVENMLGEFDSQEMWDFALVRQDLLMHYMLTVPGFEDGSLPTSESEALTRAVDAGRKAFADKLASLGEYSDQLLSLVMLHVLDEKWKDHLYDLDQLRNAIQYRSWGQTDPLVEYKQEAYSMFVDLMQDIHHTFAERFARAQIVFEAPTVQPVQAPTVQRPTRRYNALGILEDIADDELAATGTDETMDLGPAETPTRDAATTRPEPAVVGLGRQRTLTPGAPSGVPGAPTGADWTNVKRNDPCPCGSGKKFKKCHGAVMA